MGFGDPGGFSNWTPRDRALNKLVYDETQKNGGGNRRGSNNSGCALWFLIVIGGLLIAVFGRAA